MLTLIRIKRIKLSVFIKLFSASFCLMMASKVYASSAEITNPAQLEVSPERCIALRKGQTCYLNVTFRWQHPQRSDYCLVNVTTNKVIQCWEQAQKGMHTLDFQAKQTHDFVLRDKQTRLHHAKNSVVVAWVYSSSKRSKSSWRLF